MTATYNPQSPYYTTTVNGNYLDVLNYRQVPASNSDMIYTIDRKYNFRPDLLAYDIYGDSQLWWVFSVRNPDIIIDPVFGFVSGLSIFVPDPQNLKSTLGIQ